MVSISSLRPNPNMVRVCRRRGLTGGIGGALCSMPLRREAPGGRGTVVTCDVDERNLGSEMSDLLIDRLRGGINAVPPWGPEIVGVLAPEPTGDGCTRAGVAFTTNGAVGDGLGGAPISNASTPIWSFWSFCGSKYPVGVDLLLLRDLVFEGIIGDGIGDCWKPMGDAPGDLAIVRWLGTSKSS